MSALRLRLFAASLVGLVWTGTPAGAQTTAVGPYYAVPSWDQKFACETVANCPRFLVLSNWSTDAVLDRETGLVWHRTPSTVLSSQENHENFCKGSIAGGRYGWRLATQIELLSIASPTQNGPELHLPPGRPFNVNALDGTTFWSSDHSGSNYAVGLGVEFIPSSVVGLLPGVNRFSAGSSSNLRGWCVRGLRSESQ